MTITLQNLIDEHGAAAFIFADQGNGAGFPEAGQAIDYDEDCASEYGEIEMLPLESPHISADGFECEFASEWITKGCGDNPYMFRLYF